MPRQDVPYGGAICRLKEKIAEIWDELGKKLHSINGVEGDGAGDVKIVSGDAAVVITSDQVNHEIGIALDSSQLPAASVSSVNGQTGAVMLDASDINVIGGSDVETDLGNLDADLQQAQSDIAQEALTRASADSTLQTNINAVQASIPAAAATAVANDPTVAQLATDVPNKVDKITSGSSLKAYTHTGATQGETSVVDGTAANSIGIRDANGRMQAADPASGATDKTLVTANWVSQTGDSGPNNLIHRSGTETKNGRLDVITPSFTRIRPNAGKSPQNYANKFFKLFTINKGTVGLVDFEVITNGAIMRCIYDMRSDGLSHAYVNIIGDRFTANRAIITTEKDNVYTAWLQNPQNRGFSIKINNLHNLFANMVVYDIDDSRLNWIFDGTPEDEPVAADHDSIKYSEAFP